MNEFLRSTPPAVLPTLMVLVGILLNKSDIKRLDAQMGKLDDKLGKLNDKMDAMKDSFHGDILMLVQGTATKTRG